MAQSAESLQVTPSACFSTTATTVFSFSSLLSALLANLPERCHLSLSSSFFLFVGFGKLYNGIHACSFALATKNALILEGYSRVGRESSDTTDTRMSVDCSLGVLDHLSSGRRIGWAVITTEGRCENLDPWSVGSLRSSTSACCSLCLSNVLGKADASKNEEDDDGEK
jgi:hypothetical protein